MAKTISELKQEVIERLDGINKDNLTLYDFKLYVDTLSEAAKIPEASADDWYKEMLNKISDTSFACAPKAPTLSEMKGE